MQVDQHAGAGGLMVHARAPRADAVRNRARILAAARELITAHGPDAGMDQIAASAGVAVGTLYRHFPTKADLVTAVIDEYVAQVADDAEAAVVRVQAGSRAGEEVTGFIARVVEASATNHAAKAAAESLGATPGDKAAEERAFTAVAILIRTAQADGDLRADISADDVYLLVSTAPYDQPASARERWLALVLPGLAPARMQPGRPRA